MSLYKKTEAMLYNYRKTKAQIKSIEIDIELLKDDVDGCGAIVYEERTGATNAFNSSVENEVVRRDEKLKKLYQLLRVKKDEINKIDLALDTLIEDERKPIELRYFQKYQNKQVAAITNVTEQNMSIVNKKLIRKISEIVFNKNCI